MSQINVRNLSNENEDRAPDIVGVSTFSATSYFVPPKGTTAQRPTNPQGGDLRFNTDTASLEYFRGDTLNWSQIEMTSPDLDGGARAVYAGGYTAPASPYPSTNIMDYIAIPTLGNAIDFGDLLANTVGVRPAASAIRGLFYGGGSTHGTSGATIDYITFSSTGNAADFGDSSASRGGGGPSGCASSTRGIFAGGFTTGPTVFKDEIEYVTISQTGNAVDFGNLTATGNALSSTSSSTRGLFFGGYNPTTNNKIDYITIATTGNAADFGDLIDKDQRTSACSNSTRGLIMGGKSPGGQSNVITYVTIATLGNAVDFGDLLDTYVWTASAASPTRAVKGGGNNSSDTDSDVIEYVTIATTGNSLDFGNLTEARYSLGAVSNAHGGL